MKAKELVKLLERAGYRETRQKGRPIMKRTPYGALKYSIRILNNGDHTYSVEVPKLPGCYSTGRSQNECIANIVEAISLHLEGLKKAPPTDPMPAIEVIQEELHSENYLISLPEACKLLDVSDATLRRYIKDGKVPAYNFGKEYKFKIQELYQMINSSRVEIKKSSKVSSHKKAS